MKRINNIILILSLAFSFVAFSVQGQNYEGLEKIVIEGKVFYLYKVKKSEGLYRISVNYGVSQKELLEANPEIAFGLQEGQIVKIPVINGRNSTKDEIQSSEYLYHTVEPGQTVFYISRKYNVPRQVIYDNNPGADKALIVGAIIKVPKNQIQEVSSVNNRDNGYIIHEVQPKETMYALSKEYNVSIQELIKSNPALRSGVLEVGTSIRIPKESENVAVISQDQPQKLEDNDYIYHSIAQGETLYSISQNYNAEVNEVVAANPTLNADDLKLGYMVRIPKSAIQPEKIEKKEGDRYFTYHKMKRKETVFSVSRRYDVDINILQEVNSEIDLNNVNKGDLVRIPNQLWLAEHNVQMELEAKEDSEEKDSREEIATISEYDCMSYNYYDKRPTLNIAMMLPFNVEATKRVNVVEQEENGETVATNRDEKVVSRYSKVFVEFYQGALLALDTLKKQGVNVELFVYDTAPDTNKVKSILAKPEMQHMDLILGPAYTGNLPYVSEYSKEHGIPMAFPFSTKNDYVEDNIHMFQLMPLDTLLFDKMSDEIVQSAKGKRIVMIRTEDTESAFENKFSRIIRDKIYWNSYNQGGEPDFVEYKFKQDDLASLEKMLAKEKDNIVIVPSTEEAQVNRIITTVKGAREKTRTSVTLWGLPEWLKFQSINPEDMHQLNAHIFSFYAVDYTDKGSDELIQKYRKWFRTEPIAISPYFQNATVTANLSRYSLWGFDVTYYFISALKTYGKNFEYCVEHHHPFALQSELSFKRVSNWGGFNNYGLDIVNFTPDYKMKIIRP